MLLGFWNGSRYANSNENLNNNYQEYPDFIKNFLLNPPEDVHFTIPFENKDKEKELYKHKNSSKTDLIAFSPTKLNEMILINEDKSVSVTIDEYEMHSIYSHMYHYAIEKCATKNNINHMRGNVNNNNNNNNANKTNQIKSKNRHESKSKKSNRLYERSRNNIRR